MELTIGKSKFNDVVAVSAIYEDYTAARCDALQLYLYDENNKLKKLGLKKGTEIEAEEENIRTGKMYISSIAFKGKNVCIRAVSLKQDCLEERSSFKERISFKEIIEEIKEEINCNLNLVNTLDCFYIEIARAQKNPIKYLCEILGMEGYSLKIKDDTMIIFDERLQEQKLPVEKYKESDFEDDLEFNSSDSGLIESIRNTYNNPKGEYVIDTIVKSGKKGKKLQVSIAVESIGESERITKAMMWNANKYEYLAIGTVKGLNREAGQTIEIETDALDFQGKNYLYKVQHDFVNKTQKLFMRKVEGGY